MDPIEAAILRAGIDSDQPTGLAAYLVAETMAEQVLLSGHSVVVDAVNAVEPARLQWRDLAERCGVKLRVVETVCSDPTSCTQERLAKRSGLVAAYAVEQSVDEYDEWKGACGAAPADHPRHVAPRSAQNVEPRRSTSWRARCSILLPPSETKRDGGAGSPLALDRLRFPSLSPRSAPMCWPTPCALARGSRVPPCGH